MEQIARHRADYGSGGGRVKGNLPHRTPLNGSLRDEHLSRSRFGIASTLASVSLAMPARADQEEQGLGYVAALTGAVLQ